MRNPRKTDSLRRGIACLFLAVWRRASAAFALLMNTRQTDSLRRGIANGSSRFGTAPLRPLRF